MSFKVTILGSGSAVPTLKRHPTAQYIVCSNRHILIDCAEGTQLQMRKFGVKFQRIDIILISHLHGDHYLGLMGLMSTMHLLGRVSPLLIYGPEGLKEIIDTHLKHSQSQYDYKFLVREIAKNEVETLFEDKKIKIRCFPLKHKIPTSGFVVTEKKKELKLDNEKAEQDGLKIEYFHLLKKGIDIEADDGRLIRHKDYTIEPPDEKSYAFCSDTAYYEPVIEHIKGADALFHEATFTQEFADRAKKTLHSTAIEAATIAQKAAVKKLILGHFSARYDSAEEHIAEAQNVFDKTALAEDGCSFTL